MNSVSKRAIFFQKGNTIFFQFEVCCSLAQNFQNLRIFGMAPKIKDSHSRERYTQIGSRWTFWVYVHILKKIKKLGLFCVFTVFQFRVLRKNKILSSSLVKHEILNVKLFKSYRLLRSSSFCNNFQKLGTYKIRTYLSAALKYLSKEIIKNVREVRNFRDSLSN